MLIQGVGERLNDVVFKNGFTLTETAQSQGGNVKGLGLPIEDLFSQEKSTGWPVHKTVAGETIDDIEALYLGRFAQDRMCVGTDFVEACPTAADADIFNQWHSSHRGLE